MDGFRVSAEDYRRLAEKLTKVDRKVARVMRKRLREAAGPIGRHVLEGGISKMPRRGGLQAYLVATSPVRTSVRRSGVDVWMGSKKKSQLALLNRGLLRHPVFADSRKTRKEWTWHTQPVPDAAFDEALASLPPETVHRLERVMLDMMKELQL